MAPKAGGVKKLEGPTGRNARRASAKKTNSTTMEDVEPAIHPSQSSSDDGLMATIAQQMQASMEKKKKEREAKLLQMAQTELSKVFAEKAHDFADGVKDIEKIYTNFKDTYATNEDHIRRLWEAILNEQAKFQSFIEEKQELTSERERHRETEHIQALAHCRKACEESQRLVQSLGSS
ncbi:uncharacterized protein FOMMEDRAFT_166633 [Fomitiporia mediterranea MF3/22]|uniref:uncharacterized protein n=1 Tax=Fomitiporia mediterranea (strain MF3/22) TaxID=694068 RepID=UPI000440946E|nr:uncharacterized protein FOMMEDRAFT_166633 [Fomitiporia mediterranea MF3/22]EJD04877.1 hypothetical protein FOMMEDRAFT_166633 [Fomitiporia mediterranea MF3/22]